MKPTCQKCGSTALIRDDIGHGDDLDESVKCLVCGWRITKPREAVMQLAAAALSDKQRQINDKNTAMAPCVVRGCKGRVLTATNTTGMCRNCRERWVQWERGRQTNPPPFVQVNGQWVRNTGRNAA